ncbi:MAG TPA: hypothetical protein VFQ77_05630 [Pseudonocardiaceae bacterium]|nr:hypothetical protein [Pseudonocardiaceae bacterium]
MTTFQEGGPVAPREAEPSQRRGRHHSLYLQEMVDGGLIEGNTMSFLATPQVHHDLALSIDVRQLVK